MLRHLNHSPYLTTSHLAKFNPLTSIPNPAFPNFMEQF